MSDDDEPLPFRDAESDDDDFVDDEKTDTRAFWFGAVNAIAVLIWFVVGVGFMSWGFVSNHNWHWITSLYFVVQILTTIGYGDIDIPHDMYIFLTVYVLVGLMIAANIVNTYGNWILERNEQMLRQKIRNYERRLVSEMDIDPDDDPDAAAEKNEALHEELRTRYGVRNRFIVATAVFLVFLVFGTVYFRNREHCSCSYGITEIEGCRDGTLQECMETGGQVKFWRRALYMSIITMTTVGFGDFSPQTQEGRLIGLFWMIFGVLATANLLGASGDVIEELRPKKQAQKRKPPKFCRELFDQIDTDSTGWLSPSEFKLWMLVTENLVDKEVLDDLDRLFKSLDTNDTNQLEYEILAKRFDPKYVEGVRKARSKENLS